MPEELKPSPKGPDAFRRIMDPEGGGLGEFHDLFIKELAPENFSDEEIKHILIEAKQHIRIEERDVLYDQEVPEELHPVTQPVRLILERYDPELVKPEALHVYANPEHAKDFEKAQQLFMLGAVVFIAYASHETARGNLKAESKRLVEQETQKSNEEGYEPAYGLALDHDEPLTVMFDTLQTVLDVFRVATYGMENSETILATMKHLTEDMPRGRASFNAQERSVSPRRKKLTQMQLLGFAHFGQLAAMRYRIPTEYQGRSIIDPNGGFTPEFLLYIQRQQPSERMRGRHGGCPAIPKINEFTKFVISWYERLQQVKQSI